MKYENRIPEEGVNTSARSPIREFFRLIFLAAVALVSLALVLNFAGARLGGLVPFKAEVWLSRKIDQVLLESGQSSPFSGNSDGTTPLSGYLQSLGDKVERALELDDSMQITIHYSDEDTANAYATIGGHVYLFKGLLSRLPHENALVMLLAHEISHVELRHTARGIGSGMAVAVGASVLTSGARLESRLVDLVSMRFSREMETQADEAGLAAVQAVYGHVAGASDLFSIFMQLRQSDNQGLLDSFFSTHPLDAERIEALARFASEQQWLSEGVVTPLPDEFGQWL